MAKLIDHQSVPSTKSELDLFSVPPTQVSVENGFWHAARLLNTCTSTGPWQFQIQADSHYVQLNKNYLYMKLKITKADGTDLQPPTEANGDHIVGPINLIGKTLFKQVKVHVNGKLAFDSGDNYAYRSYLETELNYGWAAKATQLTAALYAKDQPPNQIENETNNTGFSWRQSWFQNSKVVEVMAPIHCDLFMTDRLLLDNTELHLELHRNNDAFALMCMHDNVNYKLQVVDMVWYVRKVELLKSLQLGLENTLVRYPAKYPVRRTQVTKLHIAAGRRSAPSNTLFTGQIPRRLVIGFVDTDAYYGTYKKSPFTFKNYNIKNIKVTAGGHVFPREPLVMDFQKDQFMRPYVQLFESMGQAKEDVGNYISLEDFKTGHCLFVFDLSPDEQDGAHWELIKDGSVHVDAEFGTDIPEGGVEMIVYAEYDNLVTIDRNRDVYFDFVM